jgi:hypothetical protein
MIGDEKLVDLLELEGEETIEGVFEADTALAQSLSHVGAHAPRTP